MVFFFASFLEIIYCNIHFKYIIWCLMAKNSKEIGHFRRSKCFWFSASSHETLFTGNTVVTFSHIYIVDTEHHDKHRRWRKGNDSETKRMTGIKFWIDYCLDSHYCLPLKTEICQSKFYFYIYSDKCERSTIKWNAI